MVVMVFVVGNMLQVVVIVEVLFIDLVMLQINLYDRCLQIFVKISRYNELGIRLEDASKRITQMSKFETQILILPFFTQQYNPKHKSNLKTIQYNITTNVIKVELTHKGF